MKRNTEDCVNARYILIGSVCKYLSDKELSRISHISRSLVNKIRNNVTTRCNQSYFFRQNFNKFRERISCIFE